jgi:hypothetical protein
MTRVHRTPVRERRRPDARGPALLGVLAPGHPATQGLGTGGADVPGAGSPIPPSGVRLPIDLDYMCGSRRPRCRSR